MSGKYVSGDRIGHRLLTRQNNYKYNNINILEAFKPSWHGPCSI